MTVIDYRVSIYNGLGRRTGTEPASYTPTLTDAREWSERDDWFTALIGTADSFVLDRLGLELDYDGDEYCKAQIAAVEDAYIALLDAAEV